MPSLSGGPDEPMPDSWANRAPSAPRVGRVGGPTTGANRSAPTGGARLATLRDIAPNNPPAQHQHDSDDDEDDEPQTFFAGGERSALSIQNPDAVTPGGDRVRDLLRRAAEGGVARPPPERSSAFGGGGNTLGSDEVESTFIADPSSNPDEDVAIRRLTFWQDGFTVEQGPLMRYDDPANERILAEIDSGHAPPEILNIQTGQQVELRVEKRLHEMYRPPAGSSTAASWGGSGNRLGAPVPSEAVGVAAPPGSFPSASADRESMTTMFEVDQSKPTTSVRIRLVDGTRMVVRMNLTHTVQDLRNFINASSPEYLARPYTIGTTFPNKTLEDPSVTIEAEKLGGSVVVMSWA